MNDHETNFSHTNGDGEKSTNEEPVQEFQQFIFNAEEVSQRRPVVRFGALIVAVGIGSYFGVGRHVKALAKLSKSTKLDLEIIRDYTTALGEMASADWQMRATHASTIRSAMENGEKFKHFPGVGVWVEGGK